MDGVLAIFGSRCRNSAKKVSDQILALSLCTRNLHVRFQGVILKVGKLITKKGRISVTLMLVRSETYFPRAESKLQSSFASNGECAAFIVTEIGLALVISYISGFGRSLLVSIPSNPTPERHIVRMELPSEVLSVLRNVNEHDGSHCSLNSLVGFRNNSSSPRTT